MEKLPSARNQGIDLLRTLSMLMVLILHILGYGGILGQLNDINFKYTAIWTLECACYGAVNCYALISGYVGVGGRFRYSQLAALWLQVVLYLLLGVGVMALIQPMGPITLLKTAIKCFFPITRNHYWYVTAYALMFLFLPLLNRTVNSLNRKQALVLCGTIFVVFSVLPTWRRVDDVFQLGSGYSILWLSLLYIVGGCVKKHRFLHDLRDRFLILGIFLCLIAMVGSNLFISTTSIPIIRDNIRNDILISYIAPTVLLLTVLLLVLCGKHPRLPEWMEKSLGFLAPASFAVYIIHAQPQIYAFLFQGTFKPLAKLPTLVLLPVVLLIAVGIYLICAVIDSLRQRLFKTLKIRQRLQSLEEKWIGDLWSTNN